jgi:hypothetical protein
MDVDRPASPDAAHDSAQNGAQNSAEPTVVVPHRPDAGGGTSEPAPGASTEVLDKPGVTEAQRKPHAEPGATDVLRVAPKPMQQPPVSAGYRPPPHAGSATAPSGFPQQPPAQWWPAPAPPDARYPLQQSAGSMPPYGQQSWPTQTPGGVGQPPRKRGRTIALLATGVVLLAAVGASGWLLLRPQHVDPELAKAEVVAATEKTDELAATDVQCPDDAVQEQGGTFTCTATVVGRQISYTLSQSDATGRAFTVRYDRPVLDAGAVADQIVSSTKTEFGVAPTDVQCPKDVHYDKNATFTCTAKLEDQPLSYVLTQTDGLGAVTVAHGRVLKVAALSAQIGTELTKGARVPVVAECGQAGQTLIVNEPGARIECRAWPTANPGRIIPIPVTVDRSGTAYPADPPK